MLNDKLRPQTNKITDQIGEKIEIDPNIVTLIGLLISIFSGVLFASGNLAAGALFIIISGICDMIDGAIARSHNRRTKFGGFLDSTCDRFADAAILIGIIYSGFVDPILGALAIHASITVSYVRSRAEQEGIKCSVGIAERAERLLIITIGSIIAAIAGGSHMIMICAIGLLTVLSYITVFQRVYHALMNLDD
ncbi:MAG TPA: CDP-alcohol phosphatidyltransferase family protein [Methanosphaera sp.]|nr:CDP-alcohol phosphatidyltransferase family protein [Methanosphaera sp.]HII09184.1 CDP-alcohol phosphatidyltransferase family protein [Methanosphaera sp.]HIJ15411.1 CDP-alcohol phosphatidyltransferase family protein [Methanosphaera sp.]